MKIEIRCPTCSRGFLVDERSRGGELMCPGCLTRIDLSDDRGAGARTVAAVAPTAPATTTTARPAAISAMVHPAAPAVRSVAPPTSELSMVDAPPLTQAAATADTDGGTVVCPRCELHFKPCDDVKKQSKASRQTVLVVDDLEYFRRVAAEALSADYEVQLAKNAAEARVAMSRSRIDLLVLDLTLDGAEAGMNFLREIQPKRFPIVIFTAQDESEMYGDSWEQLQALGADDLVIKGMNVGDTLVRKVDTLLGNGEDQADKLY